MAHYGIVAVGKLLGCTRDQIDCYIRKSGCPDASIRTGSRRVFTENDVAAIQRWLDAHGKIYRKHNEPATV